MNSKTNLSYGKVLCVIIIGGITLVILIFLFCKADINKFESIAVSVCTCLNLFATFGLIYVTNKVSTSVNKLSIDAKREDEYTQAIIKYREELSIIFRDAIYRNKITNDNYQDTIIRIRELCSNLLYYVQKHPTLKDKSSLEKSISELIHTPSSYYNFEKLSNEINTFLFFNS